MEIHILRDGTELGPFTEEVVQALLQQGSVSITDLSWRPGLGQWVPLANLLYATALPADSSSSAPPPPAESATAGAFPASSEPASARQKAFLSYLGVSFVPELTKPEAAELVNEAMENPRDPARLARWNEERLKLHPELFTAELLALKEGRAQRFFEICQDQGAEYFSKVTKAHAQVLVGYLDVTFPRWDADERAAWNYFFPAIAEKFPQLLNKEARGKFKYPEGPKVAAELARRAPAPGKAVRGFPFAAAARGVFFGTLILVVLWYVKNLRAARHAAESASISAAPLLAVQATPLPASPSDPPAALSPPEMPPGSAPASPATPEADPVAAGAEEPPPATAVNPLPEASTPSPGASSLFGPDPTPTPAAIAAAPARTSLVLTRPVEIQLAYGRIKLPPGTVVKLLQQDGANVKVSYLNNTLSIPVTSTDLGTEAPHVPPAAPAAAPLQP